MWTDQWRSRYIGSDHNPHWNQWGHITTHISIMWAEFALKYWQSTMENSAVWIKRMTLQIKSILSRKWKYKSQWKSHWHSTKMESNEINTIVNILRRQADIHSSTIWITSTHCISYCTSSSICSLYFPSSSNVNGFSIDFCIFISSIIYSLSAFVLSIMYYSPLWIVNI